MAAQMPTIGAVQVDAGDSRVTVFPSAPQSASLNSADLENYAWRGVRLTLDITAVTGTTPSMTIKLQAKDPLSGKYVNIPGAAFAAKTATGTSQLTIYPGIAAAANVSVNDALPRDWRAVATITGTTPVFTFSLGAAYLR